MDRPEDKKYRELRRSLLFFLRMLDQLGLHRNMQGWPLIWVVSDHLDRFLFRHRGDALRAKGVNLL